MVRKAILYGVISMIVFFIVNQFIMFPIGQLIFVGDEFTISYHLFTYTGLVLLCGLIVTCTGIIVQKLDEIKEAINKNK